MGEVGREVFDIMVVEDPTREEGERPREEVERYLQGGFQSEVRERGRERG